MNISITRDEYNAICDAMDFLTTGLEAANDKTAISYKKTIDKLYDVIQKYKTAWGKDEDFRYAQAVVRRESKRNLSKSEIQRLARKLVKSVKNETE